MKKSGKRNFLRFDSRKRSTEKKSNKNYEDINYEFI